MLMHKLNRMPDKNEFLAFLSAVVSGILIYIKWITGPLVNREMLLCGTLYKYGWQWEDSQGRPLLRYLSAISGDFVLPGLSVITCIVLTGVLAVMLVRLFEIKSRPACIACGFILCISPSFCSLMCYYYCLDAYTLACLLSVLFVMLAVQGKIWKCISAAGALFISLNIYQAYLGTAITLSVFYLIYINVVKHYTLGEILRTFARLCISGVSGIVSYIVVFKIYCAVTPAEATSNRGFDKMGTLPLGQLDTLIKRAYGTFYDYYIRDNLFAHSFMCWGWINLAIVLFLVLTIVIKVIRERKQHTIWTMATAAFFVAIIPLSVMSIAVYGYGANLYGSTAAIMIPHLNYIYIFLIAMLLNHGGDKERAAEIYKGAGCALLAAISFVLLLYTQIFATCADQELRQTSTVADQILVALRELPEYEAGMPLVVIGDFHEGNYPRYPLYPETTMLHEVVRGTEIYSGCIHPDYDSRMYCWINFLGFYKGAVFSEYDETKLEALIESDEVKNMPLLPVKGSARMIGDVAVVKLAD